MFLPEIKRAKSLITIMILPVILVVITTGCSVKKPQSPTWITTWEIPMTNKVFEISNLLDKIDSTNIVYDAQGNPGFNITQNFDTIMVGNSLSVNGISVGIHDSIGVVNIDAPADANATTNLGDLLPVSFGVVPPASFSFNQALPALDKFSWIEAQSGNMSLSFYNGLGVALDSFRVTLIDLADMHTVGVADYQGLANLETKTQSIDISGQRISNNIRMDFSGHCPGGVVVGSAPYLLNATMSFPATIAVTSARAEVPAFTKTQSQVSFLNDSTLVDSAIIASGSLQLNISNFTQLQFTVDIHSANFRYLGADLNVVRPVGPDSSVLVNIDLAGYQFLPLDSTTSQYVLVELTADIPGSAPSQYTINANDSLGVNVDLSQIDFSAVTGKVAPTVIAIAPIQQNIDIPNGLDQAQLTQAIFNLNLFNNSTVPANVDLTVSGNGKNISVSGLVEGKSTPLSAAAQTILSVPSSELSNFLNPPPAQITISGQAIINPDYGITTVTNNDFFYGEVEISSPFAMAILDTIGVDLDIQKTNIDSKSRPENFQETVKYGTFEANIENHLPLGTSLTVFIGIAGDSTLYTSDSTLVLGPYILAPGITDSLGRVAQSINSIISDSLGSDQLRIFDHDSVFIGQQIDLLPTDSIGILVTGTDYVRIIANTRIQLQLGDNMWNKGN